MTEKHEPKHIYRIQHPGRPDQFIAADSMHMNMNNTTGVVTFWVKTDREIGGRQMSDCVGTIAICSDLSVTRVDCLLTMEGLNPS
jgi:hypothetical protein